ncbi:MULTISPECIES: rod shape-determining protein MreC [unclassified Meiothermus]|uniref:rod shape-determining protein MreC n=1 Tax=unclassified Meiothermus TaxID=370471 RepID=UPI000D7C77AA|nr:MULTISPECIES: rod shape-determining protein MreC [unclassified Meiothermus]PZA06742.1 rod shape-determining protein MreC [Meiothermus sp. Pnk-1]RYM36667.1 rod shape-determining protein MreC [Meiothermus sp. PNK-Is4]
MTERVLRRVLLLGLLVLTLVLSSLTRSYAPALPGELAARIAPWFGWSYRVGQNLRGAVAALVDRRDLRAENRALREKANELEAENTRLKVQLRQLAAALRVKAEQAPQVVAVAPVVGEDPSGLYRRLFLGVGSHQGLRVGMPVTSAEGLVGVITEVTPNTAVVRTILDPESRVGVRLMDAPGRGIASGQPPGKLRVEFSVEAKIKPGDWVLSGSLQGLFPAGIRVGQVEEVLPHPPGALRQEAVVKPAVSLSLLEEVVVLRPL